MFALRVLPIKIACCLAIGPCSNYEKFPKFSQFFKRYNNNLIIFDVEWENIVDRSVVNPMVNERSIFVFKKLGKKKFIQTKN